MILALVVRTRRTNSMEETSKLQFFVVVEDFLSQRFHTHALLPSIYYLPTYSLQSSYSYTTCFVSNRIAGNLSSAFHNSEFSIRSGVVLMLLVMHRKSCLAETLAMFLVNPLDMHSSLRDSLDNRTYLTKQVTPQPQVNFVFPEK